MTIDAVYGLRHSESVIRGSMFHGKAAVTRITFSPATLTNGDGNKRAGGAMTGGAAAMLLRRTANRHAGCGSLGSRMATGTIGGQAGQSAMIFSRMPSCEATVASIAATAAKVTGGGSCQGTIGVVASGAGVMNFRIVGINGVAGGGMTAGTIGRHGDSAGMIDAGMIIHKSAMAE